MKAKTLCSTFVVVAMLAMAPLKLSARTLGMAAGGETGLAATVFDGDTHAVLGTVPLTTTGSLSTGNVRITPDLKRGLVTDFNFEVFVVDLTTSPPSLAAGTNPIPISHNGEDLSISPDGKFLVVSGGAGTASISVIDIAAQAEISTFSTGSNINSLDVCSDGSVLAASFDNRTVHRLTLSNTGTLTDTGEVLSVSDDPMNVYCAPGATSGIIIEREVIDDFPEIRTTARISSFSVPGLTLVHTRPLSDGDMFTGAISRAGNRVFVRAFGSVDVFDFIQAMGALGVSPLLTFSLAIDGGILTTGLDQVAPHPNGGKLFVAESGSGSNAVNVYDPSTGALLASITDPALRFPTSVAVMTQADPCAGSPPPGAIVGTNGPNTLNGTPGNDKIFGLGGSDTINGKGGNDLICGGAGNDLINGGAGNDTIDAGSGSDTANGDAGNDTIKGGAGNDLITGGAGDDVLDAQDGVNGNDSVNDGTHVSGDTCTADPGDGVSSCSP
jgi:Ca2+-binding RTX toxin-like protein